MIQTGGADFSKLPGKRRDYMRFLEVLKTIRNKFIRKNPQTQPEDTQSVPEETRVPEKAKTTITGTIQPNKKEDE